MEEQGKMETDKKEFEQQLKYFVESFKSHISTENGEWTVKGFIDTFKNIYTISGDTKVISKIFEIHLFPKILEFADYYGYNVVLADHQNYYPDLTFIKKANSDVKFAVDFKTSYRLNGKPHLCNGFTLGSHGNYFINRNCKKNIQFPYSEYSGHFCLGIIYSRTETRGIDDTKSFNVKDIHSISSVAKDFQFFVSEKWKIASDKSGSGNTANIGSIRNIEDIVMGRGMFSKLGEDWFDDYWINYNKITVVNDKNETVKINTLKAFVEYRKGDTSLIIPKRKLNE